MTIEQRAEEKFPINWVANFSKSYDANSKDRNYYIDICKEQQKDDLEKACFAFCVATKCPNRVNLACSKTCEKLMMFKLTLEEQWEQ